MESKNHLKELLQKYAANDISGAELQQLNELLNSPEHEEGWKSVLFEMSQSIQSDTGYNELEWEPVIESILNNANTNKPTAVVRSVYWGRIAAAVTAILLLSVAGYLLLKRSKDNAPVAVHQQPQQEIPAPANNKATITLADGSILQLEDAANGQVAAQGATKIIKNAEGQISYQPGVNDENVPEQYNTLFNPRGSKAIMIRLADGSKVWLNAASTLKYPIAFRGKERVVEITGEGYFEVVHNSAQPFKVKASKQMIQDVGTSFNVMAYTNEKAIVTTLVEGKINLSGENDSRQVQLEKGDQAVASFSGNIIAVKANADVALATAWKNGLQTFKRADLSTIMRQVERWYNVDVVYETAVPEGTTFTGEDIANTVNLSELLKVFEKNQLHFIIDGEHHKVRVVK